MLLPTDGLIVLENIPASVRCRDHAVNIFKYPDVSIDPFNDKDVTVSQGNTKKSVVVGNAVTVVNAMDKLYMTVTLFQF